MFLQTAKCGVSAGEVECYFTECLEEKAVGMDWQGLNRESFLFCLTSNVPRRIKLCASLAEPLPTQTVQNNKSGPVSCTFHQTRGGHYLRHLQGFSALLRRFWPPVFVNSLTDEEKIKHNQFKEYYLYFFIFLTSCCLMSCCTLMEESLLLWM